MNRSPVGRPVPRSLKLLRCTKYFPRVRGLNFLLRCYRARFPGGAFSVIDDFDGDLLFKVNICETLGINLWHAPRQYERLERELFCAALTPGCAVLDIGANQGVYSLIASKRGARVFAVEADPINAGSLRDNLDRNDLQGHVQLFELAALNRSEVLTLYRHPFNSGGSSLYGQGDAVRVDGRPIDSLQLPPIDVCKMDIEGAELPALEGMVDTIRRSPRMKLLLECSRDHAEIGRFLRARFRTITVVGKGALGVDDPPAYCNLWASN
jgi:FkbM family methyltransferase